MRLPMIHTGLSAGRIRPVLLALLCLATAACTTLPRGAGLQSEILESNAEDPAQRDFIVAPVTRALLPVYAEWPGRSGLRGDWIERVDQPNNRIIAAGDTVSITIWSTEESGLLTNGSRFAELAGLRVSPGGTVFLPYVGTTRIAGMSPERAREQIEQSYLDVIPSAQVLLTLEEGRQNTVSVIGGVGNPGVYPLPDTDFTVLGVIAQAGGISGGLNNPQIRLNRGTQSYGTSVERLLDQPRLDTTLQGGDQVFVEADDRVFLSLGAAGTEARHPFPSNELTALEALSIIGGVSDSRADPQGILILRSYPASAVRADGLAGPQLDRVVFTIDLTSADGLFSAGQFHIQPDDLVYATESPVTAAQTVFGILGSALGTATRLAAAGS